ncbi:alpha/beta hydrolase family protein [Nonomuraea spiralis]|uniref:Alpha/beta hydrolase family protein n=1 Tax=Nonomuraea spiralis TaxID=46182 RepID=A0ABV5IK23_9ACTN|nr:hypothetical protein [Nonomuraea spiralis]
MFLRLLVAALGATATLTVPAQATALTLTLPRPGGPHPIGTAELYLVDPSRTDPYTGSKRELMISLWYPAKPGGGDRAPYLPPAAAALYIKDNGLSPQQVRLPLTHARLGAPVRGTRLPVLLYSPGNGADRGDNTAVVEELASRGYLVVTVDHTHDSSHVEFPGGRVETHTMPAGTPPEAQVELRSSDMRFVLDQIAVLNGGGDPGAGGQAGGHRLPPGLRGAFDLGRVGMFGASMGGATVAATMLKDPRVKAGLSLDGPAFGPVVRAGLSRPYMLMSARADRAVMPELATFWRNLRGWKLNVKIEGAVHASFGDAEVLYPQAVGLLGWTPEQLRQQIGTLPPERGLAVQRTYPVAFFDRHLRGRDSSLLHGPSPRFPEVTRVP